MRILCDQNVSQQYIDALRAHGFEVELARNLLDARANDPDIAAYAEANGWVVFTCDTDFFDLTSECSVLYYNQYNAPTAGDVVATFQAIDRAYSDPTEITLEVIPGEWI
jgi:predicted nuclease of predicted toxin-antitoxin system